MSDRPDYTVDSLMRLMQLLRDPVTGCPWDRKQTPEQIVPFTLEEVHEVVDAIEMGDWGALREELGDLLFQVAFYCQMADEKGHFSLHEVVHDLVAKMIRRHPHVFPTGKLEPGDTDQAITEQELWRNWELIKAREKAEKGGAEQAVIPLNPLAERFARLPKGLGALAYAQKVQISAKKHGLDWPGVDGVLDRLREEMREFDEAVYRYTAEHTAESKKDDVDSARRAAIAEELGDVLFTCVNVARHLRLDAEQCLRQATRKFRRRAEWVEQRCHEEPIKRPLAEIAPDVLDHYWAAAKAAEASD